MPAIPPPTIRAPPSSQPVLPTRNKSAFPSLQRPRPGQPPSFGRPSSTQARQSQPSWRDSQAPSQSQSQRPPPNRLDNRYSPPSSQPTQLFPSQIQTQRQVSRPPSSLGGSQHGMGIIDQYRPDSILMPRTAAQVYQGDRPSSIPPKAQKGVELLEKIAGLYSMIEEKFGKKEEEDTEFQEALEDRLKDLEDENKDLKERLHELSMGQKVLPTKSELNEEISSQLTPALNDFLESITETIKKTVAPVPEDTAELAAGRVKIHMLEMQDLARKEAVREGAVENPLMTLLNHLITKLGPLDDITSTLSSLSGLPEALEQVAVFRETMKTMQDRISNRTEPQAQAHAAHLPSIDVNQISKLQETMEEIMRKAGAPSEPTVGLDSGKVFSAITGLKRALEEVKVSVGMGSGSGEIKEMRDLILEMKTEMAGMKNTLANLTRPVPTPATDHEMSNTLRAILEQLKHRPIRQVVSDTPTPVVGQAHTPTTGIRPASDIPQPPESEDTASPLRIFDRPIRPTPWARQDPAAMRIIANRSVQSDPAGGEGSDIFGTIQPIPSNSTTMANKKQKTKPPSTLKFTLPIPKDFQGQSQGSQSTSSRNSSTGSVANKMKRKTPPNSLSLRPTTRSCSNRGKEIGIDVINLESSESSGKKRGRVVPETSNSGDTTWPLGLPDSVRPENRPRLGAHDQPIGIETPPLPETQDLGHSHSQSQTQPQTQTQLNTSQIDSTFEFGHGQLPSVPSLPGYESTQYETQVDTPAQPEKEVTSTELVEQSLALPTPPTPTRRAEPGYRKYQGPRTYGGSTKMHGFLGGNFGLLLDSDDEG